MTLPLWPKALPKGWKLSTPLKIVSGVSRREMLSGHVRQRVQQQKPFDLFNAKLEFTDLEFRLFEYFIRDVLHETDWYLGPYRDGPEVQEGAMRLTDKGYKASQTNEGNWNVTASIEIKNRK